MAIAPAPADHPLWIFAYGSLMWRPGFASEETRRARLPGYHRAFCVYSVHHRGSLARPGLVLGLDRGGRCEGIAYRVAPGEAAATLSYLRAREQVTSVYREVHVPVILADGDPGEARAVAFVVEPAHPSYAGRLPLGTQARLVRGAKGRSGINLDYLVNTLAHLRDLGVSEPRLERLLTVAGPFASTAQCAERRASRIEAMVKSYSARPVPVPRLARQALGRFGFRSRLASSLVAKELGVSGFTGQAR